MGPKRDISNFNPFPGLRPFSSDESPWFFGREEESKDVLRKLLDNRFVAVIGASGCGKSSLIRCGVLPAVQNQEVKGDTGWRIITFKPGNDPLGNMAHAIAENISATGQQNIDWNVINSELQENTDGILSVIKKFTARPNEKVLIVIDQFEEIFRYNVSGKKETVAAAVSRIVEFITEVGNKTSSGISALISMRSDFIGECSYYHGLTQLINNSNYLVAALEQEDYRRAIEGPVEYAGAKIDPELVTTLLNDTGGRPFALPVFQHTMMRTWEQWQEADAPDLPISRSDYEAAGTMNNALSLHANKLYEELSPRAKEICEVMFKTITEKGTDNKGSRNPIRVERIKYFAECSNEELFGVIEKFRMPSISFLTPESAVPLDDNSIIDLSNDGLIRSWGRLKDWVEEESASAKMYLRLSESSAMYQQGKAGLWKSPDLQLAVSWRERRNPTLRWAERYNPAFERAMVYLRTSEKKFIEDEANKLRLQKRRVRRIRIIASLFAVVALLSAGFSSFAFIKKVNSDRHALVAEMWMMQAVKDKTVADSSANQAIQDLEKSDSTARVYSQIAEEARIQKEIALRKAADERIRALEQSDSAKRIILAADQNTKMAVEQKNEALRLRMLSVGKVLSMKSVMMQGQKELQSLLAYQAFIFNKNNNGLPNDADIYAGLYNADRLNGSTQIKSYKGHNGEIRSIAFIPGKNEFFTSGNDGQILKWSVSGSTKTFQVFYSGTDVIDVLAVSPDANWLACGGESSSIKMIPLKGSNEKFEMKGHQGKIKSLVFSFDSNHLYSASLDGKVYKWEITARTYTDVSSGLTQIASIDISSNGRYLAGVSTEGKVVVWDPETRTDNFRIEAAGRNINVVKFNPDNNLLAVGDINGNVELWDVNLHKKISEVKAHDSRINDITFNPKMNQMATAGNDKTVKIFNIKNPSDLSDQPITFADNEGIVLVIEFSPDSRLLFSGTDGGDQNLVSRPTHADFLASGISNLVSRNMTQDEWNSYVGKDIPFEKTCNGRSFNIKVDPIR